MLYQADASPRRAGTPPSDYDRYLRLIRHLRASHLPYAPIAHTQRLPATLSSCGYMQFLGRGCRVSATRSPLPKGSCLCAARFPVPGPLRNWERHGLLVLTTGASRSPRAGRGASAARDKRPMPARYLPQVPERCGPASAGTCSCGAQLASSRAGIQRSAARRGDAPSWPALVARLRPVHSIRPFHSVHPFQKRGIKGLKSKQMIKRQHRELPRPTWSTK